VDVLLNWRWTIVQDHARVEVRVWIGFAVSFSLAFLTTILAQEGLTDEQVWAVWSVALSAGFVNHGAWHRDRTVLLSSSLSMMLALLALALVPALFPAGWLILGLGSVVSGVGNDSRTQVLIGVFVALGGMIHLLAIVLATSPLSVLLVWLVLAGLIFITVGTETTNPVPHFMGLAWILASVASYAFFPDFMFWSLVLVFALGMIANLLYLYRLLGRAPRIGEILSFATHALFLKGLRKPIDQYRVLAILLQGNIGARNVTHDVLTHLEPACVPVLLLGPTAPMELSISQEARVGWVAGVSGSSTLEYPLLSPEDPTAVSVFLAKTLDALPKDVKPVILGDFLDNMLPHMDESLFYRYYSDLASAARVSKRTLIPIVSVDIHGKADVNVVKRFADVIIENREREERGRLIREVRVSNRVDNIHTDWERY
jgi:hypothetical protein